MSDTLGPTIEVARCVADERDGQVRFDDYWGHQLEHAFPLIQSWLRRADNSLQSGEPFEAFIFTWIALNGWAERVTGYERDSQWLAALAGSGRIRSDFDSFLQADPGAASAAEALTDFAPVFRARDQRRLPAPSSTLRRDRVAYWLNRSSRANPNSVLIQNMAVDVAIRGT